MIHSSRTLRAGLSLAVGGLLVALALPVGVAALDLPPAQPGRYVYDLAGVFSPPTIDRAQATIAAIKDRTGAEIAVVSWPSGQGTISPQEALADGRTIIDTWGVGRRDVNDGLVILFDMDASLSYGQKHGQVTLATGGGFRDLYLTDGEAKAIVDEAMVPSAKIGDLDGALSAALARIDAAVVSGGNPAHAQTTALLLAAGLVAGAGGGALLAFFLFTWWRRGRDAEIPLIDDSVLLPAPPPGLTPALATVLRKDAIDTDAFTSALVDLGHRGLIVFRQKESDRKKLDFVVPPVPLDDPGAVDARRRPLGDAETALIGAVRTRAGASGDGVVSSDELRKGAGAKLYASFRKGLGKAAKASPWFRDDPTRLTGLWQAVGIVALVVAGVAAVVGAGEQGVAGDPGLRPHAEPLAIGCGLVAIAAVVMLVCSRFLAARTAEGGQVLAMALAYRNTLRHVIADAPGVEAAVANAQPRLPWIGTPDELAVWATALGLRKEIDDLFKRSLD
ncbi:MAG TPA: TPM domain-containing protein, partial [Candidatus Limnocylindrales bacterium]